MNDDKVLDRSAQPVRLKKSLVREYVEAILVAVVLAFFIRTFVVQAFKIPSGSMQPTLLIGDHILVNKFIYGMRLPFTNKTIIPVADPKRNDIMVFKFPQDMDKDFIKRVIGLPGDKVEVRDKKIFINDAPLDDLYGTYLDSASMPAGIRPRDNMGPVTVPPHSLFVMGDNRDQSYDSRFWGFVDFSMVKGKAFMVYWSWNSEKFGIRWDRIGKLIH